MSSQAASRRVPAVTRSYLRWHRGQNRNVPVPSYVEMDARWRCRARPGLHAGVLDGADPEGVVPAIARMRPRPLSAGR